MPIKIADQLPARRILESENVFVMTHGRAATQDIRALRILILNLMPTKIETETQLLRLLSNSPLQVDIDLMQTATHISRNTSSDHLLNFYHTFDELKHNRYDGMIITGAPVENLAFHQVDYWSELCEIMEWSKTNVYSTLHICWGAQAGMSYHYGVEKFALSQKLSGVYPHTVRVPNHPLLRGFDDVFYMPHSRYTATSPAAVEACPQLQLLADSPEAGVAIVASRDARQIFITGHFEYDRMTLANEYQRDVTRGLAPAVPEHYFPGDDPRALPHLCWRGHAALLYANWLNYCVYQQTPYDLQQL